MSCPLEGRGHNDHMTPSMLAIVMIFTSTSAWRLPFVGELSIHKCHKSLAYLLIYILMASDTPFPHSTFLILQDHVLWSYSAHNCSMSLFGLSGQSANWHCRFCGKNMGFAEVVDFPHVPSMRVMAVGMAHTCRWPMEDVDIDQTAMAEQSYCTNVWPTFHVHSRFHSLCALISYEVWDEHNICADCQSRWSTFKLGEFPNGQTIDMCLSSNDRVRQYFCKYLIDSYKIHIKVNRKIIPIQFKCLHMSRPPLWKIRPYSTWYLYFVCSDKEWADVTSVTFAVHCDVLM